MANSADYMQSKSYIYLRNLVKEKNEKILQLENTIKILNDELKLNTSKRDFDEFDLKNYVLNTKWTYNNLKTEFLGIILFNNYYN